MSQLSGSDEFDSPLQKKYWILMESALKKGLTLYLSMTEKNCFLMLIVQIYSTEDTQKVLFLDSDLDMMPELFYRTQSFVENYK